VGAYLLGPRLYWSASIHFVVIQKHVLKQTFRLKYSKNNTLFLEKSYRRI